MSSVLYQLGRWTVRARRSVLAAWLAVLVLAGAGGVPMLRTGPDDSFRLPGQSSQFALDRLVHVFPEVGGTSAQIVVLAPEGRRVDTPLVRSAVAATAERARSAYQVIYVVDPFAKDTRNGVSADGRAAMIDVFLTVDLLHVSKRSLTEINALGADLQARLGDGSVVHVGGDAYGDRVPKLSPTEGVGLVVALVVLLFTFGSFVAAGLPIATALVGVGVSYGLIYSGMRWTPISSTAPMIAVMVGLAVGIDYALFILSRHREQLATGLDVEESVARATATAGSAVVFAGTTVFIAFAGLFVAGIPFLTTLGQAGALGVLVAVLVALTAVPALMTVAGERLRPRPRRPRRGRGSSAPAQRFAEAWVRLVTRVPLLTVVLVVAGLAVCALPARHLQLALPDNGTNDVGTQARTTYDVVSDHFGPGYNAPLLVMLDVLAINDPIGVTNRVADEVRRVPGIAAVPIATPNHPGDTSIIEVIPDSASDSPATGRLVDRLRAMAPHIRATYGVDSWVTGFTAVTIDISTVLRRGLIPFLVLVVGLSLVLLAMVFRSVLVPIKASIGYLLSLGAAFGATSFVFVDGHFASALRVQHVGSVISFLPIILMGVLFGLAMDYEVFLVSRMREHYVHHRDAQAAIRHGFVSASRVVVAAALIMLGVFAAFVPHGSSTIKPVAFALGVGVLVDAFVVRMTLVPAVMTLLGDRAWWLPGPLDRRLPVLDAEGDGLLRELRLADWPSPGGREVVAARGLTLVADDGSTPVRGLDLAVEPGGVLVVDGERPCGKSALLLALGGHVATLEGDVKVLGSVLPQHNRLVRRRAALVRAGRDPDAAGRAGAALASGVRLLLVDDADGIVHPADRRALGEALAANAARAARGEPAAAVILTCADRASLDELLSGVPAAVLSLSGVPAAVLSLSDAHPLELSR